MVLAGCVPAFAWVILTRELSFAGSFGLFGGHWMLGVLMPVAVLSLVSLIHALQRLGFGADQEAAASPTDSDDEPGERP